MTVRNGYGQERARSIVKFPLLSIRSILSIQKHGSDRGFPSLTDTECIGKLSNLNTGLGSGLPLVTRGRVVQVVGNFEATERPEVRSPVFLTFFIEEVLDLSLPFVDEFAIAMMAMDA